MNWFYADGGNQKGPVSDSELDELLRSGKISPNTLVWREGMTHWQPLNTCRAVGQSGVVCVECGKAFPPEQIVTLNNSPVCGQCKPIFLQRMAQGAPMPSFGDVWRQNRRLVARPGTTFPDRCVKCNGAAEGYRLKRTLYWAHPAYLLLIFCSLPVLLIVYLIVRKKAVVHIGLCERHRTQRKVGIIVALSSVVMGIALIGCAAGFNSGWCAAIGVVGLLVGLIVGGVMARTVAPVKIEKEYVWMNGVHRDFLADLPQWSGP